MFLLALILACGGGDMPEQPAPEPAAAPGPAEAHIIELTGEAADAKAGAVVVCEEGVHYVRGLASWPEELLGKAVVVRGEVRTEKFIPDPRTPDGEIAQGAWGDQAVIYEASWRLAQQGSE